MLACNCKYQFLSLLQNCVCSLAISRSCSAILWTKNLTFKSNFTRKKNPDWKKNPLPIISGTSLPVALEALASLGGWKNRRIRPRGQTSFAYPRGKWNFGPSICRIFRGIVMGSGQDLLPLFRYRLGTLGLKSLCFYWVRIIWFYIFMASFLL